MTELRRKLYELYQKVFDSGFANETSRGLFIALHIRSYEIYLELKKEFEEADASTKGDTE